jgi:hemoglobin/transferrin/lactoferrin receptor protein
LAYADGEDKATGRELDSIAPFTANVGLGYNSADQKYGALVNYKFVAKKDDWEDEDNIEAPSYNIVDLTAYYRPIKDMTVRAGLFNVFDEKYWVFSDLSGESDGLSDFDSQAGRNWGASVEYNF